MYDLLRGWTPEIRATVRRLYPDPFYLWVKDETFNRRSGPRRGVVTFASSRVTHYKRKEPSFIAEVVAGRLEIVDHGVFIVFPGFPNTLCRDRHGRGSPIRTATVDGVPHEIHALEDETARLTAYQAYREALI